MRRVVVTGLGIVSPVGSTVNKAWDNIKNGVSGIRKINSFDKFKKIEISNEFNSTTIIKLCYTWFFFYKFFTKVRLIGNYN